MAGCSVGPDRAARPTRTTAAASPAPTAEEPDPAASSVPELPARADVARALSSITAAVRDCAPGEPTAAVLTITFNGTGHVNTATVDTPYAGTPAGSCMARAARAASIPPFARATFRVRAPFNLH
jgi:hypothetical protein